MEIKIGYEITFDLPVAAEAIFLLSLHPSRMASLVESESFIIDPTVSFLSFVDHFGNNCGRAHLPVGRVSFINSAIVEDDGLPDPVPPQLEATQWKICELPAQTLQFLTASRYCEVDSELGDVAWSLFGSIPGGWAKVQAICDFVHQHLKFDYLKARNNRTAREAYQEKVGVCRDFTHLAITLCRCMNIPARYATGYLGDIGVPPDPHAMDFSAWFEVFLGDRWWTFDARHNQRRIGRVLMATGRDAADVALTTIFGKNQLIEFRVQTEQLAKK